MINAIANVLFKFANSFDLKDWQSLENTLMEYIECDYKDLRDKSETFSKDDYINTRKLALENLKTQHLFSNLEITLEEKQAYCRLSAIIYRQDNEGKYFHSHAIYHFYLDLQNNVWKIKKIKQSILWNEGDSSIHKGVIR